MNEHTLVATHSHVQNPRLLPLPQRCLSITVGAALLVNGLRVRGWGGLLQAGVGAYALFIGASGSGVLKKALTHTPFEEEFQEERGWRNSEAVSRSITIGRSKNEVLAFISEPANVAYLIPWVDSVETTGPKTSRWTVSTALGRKLHVELSLEGLEDDCLHWTAEPGSTFEHDIAIHFADAPANRGTEVKVVVVGNPPLGKAGYMAANALAPFTDKALLNLLRSIKQKLETGEVSTNLMRAPAPKTGLPAQQLREEGNPSQSSSARAVNTSVDSQEGDK